MKKLNFAIVGAGRIGTRHAEHANKFGRLVAIADIEREKAQLLGNNYLNTRIYEDINSMLENEKIDVLAICTPNGLHYEHSKAGLLKGVNILCEKPITLESSQAIELIDLAEKNNVRYFALKQNRFNPPVAKLKELIDNNVLGKIYSFHLSCFWNRNKDYYDNSWKGTLKLDGGTLYTQFSHFLDLIIWLFGDHHEVFGYFENFKHHKEIEFEDTGVISLKMKSGALGSIHYTVNAFSKNMEGSLTLHAENGSIKIGGQYLNELEYQDIKNYKITDLREGNKPNNYGNYVGSMSNHGEVYKNLVEVINKNGSIATSGIEGYRTIKLIEDIYSTRKLHGSN